MTRSNEQAIAGVMSGLIGPDEEVTWEARHFGLRVRMTSRITEYDRPRAFTDEQVSGPFAS
jgi:ligand-binding SRPBCC domain-containing protein